MNPGELREANKVQDTSIRQSVLWQRIALAVFGIIILLFGLFVYWSSQTSKVLVVNNDPVSVRPPEVQANGGVIILTVDYCKNSGAHGVTEAFLIGETFGGKIAINWPVDRSPKGCNKLDVPVPIPAQAPTDTYHIVYEITYRVNPIKSGYTTFRSQSFKVINEKLQPGDAKPIPQ